MSPPACVDCKFYKTVGLEAPACTHPDHRPVEEYDVVKGERGSKYFWKCDFMRRSGENRHGPNQPNSPCGPEGKLFEPNLWARVRIRINNWLDDQTIPF